MTEAAEALDPQMPHEPFEQAELPGQPDPRDIARAVAMSVADEPEQVGEVVNAIELDDNVTDFRLAASVRGYEGWQWSVTLYHDVEVGTWTVNESSLVPTDDALMPPAWVPWKDRLEPTDLAPTDSIGTDPDDPRLEGGFRKTEPVAGASAGETEQSGDKAEVAGSSEPIADKTEQSESVESTDEQTQDATESEEAAKSEESAETQGTENTPESAESAETAESAGTAESQAPQESLESEEAAKAAAQAEETEEIVEEFQLSRRHVLSPKGRAQVAKRWYEGPRGPKAMSTKTADGNLCSTCGFFVPLQGDLNRMFGVCANKWSPDDGRVVSIDHGCGEHSEIEPPEPTHLWVQSKPAYDDFHIDVIAQKPRDERGAVEAIEQLDEDAQDSDEATEEDILANTEPDTGDDEPENAQPSGVEASAELEAVVSVAADGGEAEASDTDEADETEAAEDAEAEEAESDESKSDESEKTEKSAEVAESEPAETETTEPETSDAEEPADANDSAEASEETKAAETVALTDLDKQVEAVDAAIEDAAASLAAEIDDEAKDALAEAESAETEDAAETVETVEVEETTETVEVEPAEAAETEKAEESTEAEESEQPESVGAEETAESSESADPEEPSDSAEAEESKDPETAEKPEEPADSAE